MRLGEYDVSTTAEPLKHVEIDVESMILHPGFNNATLVNDIALLKLERNVKRRQNIDAVCMETRNEINVNSSPDCYVTGWGRRTESKYAN